MSDGIWDGMERESTGRIVNKQERTPFVFDADPLRGPNGESPCFAPCGKPECRQGCFRVTRTAATPPSLPIRERVEELAVEYLTENGWTQRPSDGGWTEPGGRFGFFQPTLGDALNRQLEIDVQLARDASKEEK